MELENPFKINTIDNFTDSPPFGLYDIFNYLICHSTTYDKQGLAAYKSFERLQLIRRWLCAVTVDEDLDQRTPSCLCWNGETGHESEDVRL